MDKQLIFTVLIAANGYRPQLVKQIDATDGKELALKLESLPENLPPTRKMKGQVVDANGKPVFGALVSIVGALQGDRNWGGRVNNVDTAAVSDADGRFMLTSTEDYRAWRLSVNATGFVGLNTDLLKTGDKSHNLVLDPGSTVSGRITNGGKPASGVTVGLCQINRSAGKFAGEYVIASDENGYFQFSSVVPNEKMTIYSKMEKGNSLATEIAQFSTAKSGGLAELGALKLRSTKTLSGKLSCLDNQPFPKNFRIYVGRKNAWDSQTVDVDEKGYFKIEGLPIEEAIEISIRLKGYSIDHSRTNLQVTGPTRVAIFTDADLASIKVDLKPN